jgi:hypothetical protein
MNQYTKLSKLLKESSPAAMDHQKCTDVCAALLTAKIIFNEMGRKDLSEKLDDIKKEFKG